MSFNQDQLDHMAFEPGTWWWRAEPDGRRVLYPLMTLEKLDLTPTTDIFRCVRCKVEDTFLELQAKMCVDLNWYHGDIRAYRRLRTPMRCAGKDPLDGLPCCNEWVRALDDGLAGTSCPACGSRETEAIA